MYSRCSSTMHSLLNYFNHLECTHHYCTFNECTALLETHQLKVKISKEENKQETGGLKNGTEIWQSATQFVNYKTKIYKY